MYIFRVVIHKNNYIYNNKMIIYIVSDSN